MKKTTKGALAAGAAAVLLAGGAGTYAAWTAQSPSLEAGSITTGHLTVTEKAGSSTGWTWVGGAKNGEAVKGSDTIAPGDKVAYTGIYVLGIKGTNLNAKVDVTTPQGAGIPEELQWTPFSSAPITGLTESQDGQEITAGGTLEFLDSAVGTMDATIPVGNFQVVLKQTAPAVAN